METRPGLGLWSELALRTHVSPIILIVVLLCASCTGLFGGPTPLPSPTPSPTPVPKVLTICLSEEPESLYLYGSGGLAAQHIWQAIYDGPLDSTGYAHQPVLLTGLPALSDGSAAVEEVTVQAGDRVLVTSGEVARLSVGMVVRDAGGQPTAFDGAPILMLQMVVTFTLRPDLVWSDGTPLTSYDSVFSFEVAADPATPVDRVAVDRTAGYAVVDARTVVWRGVPGFLDQFYYLNFWHPLPRHAWGHLTSAELLTADASTRRPLGWGAFVLREWLPGDRITLERSPTYFRAAEGLPYLDQVVFRFVPDPMVLAEELLAGRCDVVTHEVAEAVRAVLPAQPPLRVLPVADARWELLAFGISPAEDYRRPDFFEDVRVRQAVALCIDRQTLVSETLGTAGQVLHSYLPPDHPLYAGEGLTMWGYDPPAGQALLDGAGWTDGDGDGVREAHGIAGIPDGTPFQVTYHTSGDPLRLQVARRVQTYLAACGIQATLGTVASEILFASGPEGVLFGRRFDLAQFSWRAAPDPMCDLFLSGQIPGELGWDRPNVAGFIDDRYDVACLLALEARPGDGEYAAGILEAQHIFSERLPVLPLFQHSKVVLAGGVVLGLAPDPTQDSELWNIERLDLQR